MFSFRTLLVAAALTLSLQDANAGGVTTRVVGSNSADASSWVVGGHAGYNWQQGSVVWGFETDLQATHLKSQMNDNLVSVPPGPLPPGSFADTIATVDWYGTLRGRVGVASGQWLFYGTGGLAYGWVGLSSRFGTLGLSTNFITDDVKVGFVGGVGVEYLWRPDVSVRVGYQYVDLGRLSGASTTTFNGLNFNATLSQSATTHAQFQTVTAGITWHFAPMPTQGSWAGGYAGGHAGGAWGNSASAVYNALVNQGVILQ